jgi:hypothetical protein
VVVVAGVMAAVLAVVRAVLAVVMVGVGMDLEDMGEVEVEAG